MARPDQSAPKASVFQTTEWLGALSVTYGYNPVAFTTSPPEARLENAFVAATYEAG